MSDKSTKNVFVHVILSTQKREMLFERVRAFCEENRLRFGVLRDEVYYKVEGCTELLIEFYSPSVWNYGKWSAAYRYLFEQGFTIEYEANEDICLCYYPACGDLESYFVRFYIPSQYFYPKPSKSVRH